MPIDRRAYVYLAAGFLAVIIAPAVIQTVAELRRGETPGALELFLRPPTARNLHAYEHGLEASSLVIQRLRPRMQYAEWRFLDDAGEKAVVGREGWLFYRPSVRYEVERPAIGPESDSSDPLPAIRSFRDQLQARGIRLLVVPVPNKESIYPELLTRRAQGLGVVVNEQTQHLLDELDRNGIEHVDLFQVFRRVKQDQGRTGTGRLYLARDTHWSPAGVQAAAASIARQVLAGGVLSRGDHAYSERSVVAQRAGDLVEMLRSASIKGSLLPESVVCSRVVQSDSGAPYEDRPDSEILILGDSFLRIYEHDVPGAAGLIAHLARELGRPLASIVNDGGGSTLVRQDLARRPALLSNKKLVIWEFAEREIRFGTEGWRIVRLARSASEFN